MIMFMFMKMDKDKNTEMDMGIQRPGCWTLDIRIKFNPINDIRLHLLRSDTRGFNSKPQSDIVKDGDR
jgi:hypothetical protein